MRTFYFKARTIGQEKYLTYTMGEDCELDEDALDYIEENKPVELVDIIYEEDDDYDYLTYEITDRTSLDTFIKQDVKCENVLYLLRNIASSLISLKEQTIHLNYILLNRSFVYVDDSLNVYFMCVPVETKGSLTVEFKGFVRELLANMVYDVDEDLNYVGKLLTYINGDNFNLRGLIGLSEAIMEEEGISFEEAGGIESEGVEVISTETELEVEVEEKKESNVADFMKSAGNADEPLPEIGDDDDDIEEEEADEEDAAELESIVPKGLKPKEEPVAEETDVQEAKASEAVEENTVEAKAEEAEEAEAEKSETVEEKAEEASHAKPEVKTAKVEQEEKAEPVAEKEKEAKAVKEAPSKEESKAEKVEAEESDAVVAEEVRVDENVDGGETTAETEATETEADEKEVKVTRKKNVTKETDVDIIKSRINAMVNGSDGQDANDIKSIDDLDSMLNRPPVVKKNVVKVNRAALIQSAADHDDESGVPTVPVENLSAVTDEGAALPNAENGATDLSAESKPKSSSILSKKVDAPQQVTTTVSIVKINPYLIRVNTEERIMITKPIFKLGKSARGVDYTVSGNGAISRQHAIIIQKDGVCYIRDNKSTNHTYVNDRMVEEGVDEILTHDSMIRLGDEEFKFKIR